MNYVLEKYKEIINNQDYNSSKLYLITKLNSDCGFFVFNNFICYLQKSSSNNTNSISTSYVDFIPNNNIKSVVNFPSFSEGMYDLLVLKDGSDFYLNDSFINFCTIYANNPTMNFNDFIQAIVDLFQLPKEQKFLDCIGFIGELSLIKYFYEKKIDLSYFWHKNGLFSKYDFSLKNINLEVKTSISDNKIFKIKHSQIFNSEKNYLFLIDIRETDNGGDSLDSLISFFKTNPVFNTNLKFMINLEKELKKNIDPDFHKKRFNLTDIHCFDVSKLATINKIPTNISEISYNYDFDFDESLDNDEIFSIVRNNI